MKKLKILVLSFFIVSCLTGVAGPVTDTLFSSQNDRIIVTYDLVEKDGTVEIHFIKVNKKLSKNHGEVYGDNLSYVKVMFFDREYDFQDVIFKGGLSPKLFMIPNKELVYSPSDEGYFIIDDGPVLRFEGQLSKPTTLSIPLFLAHYKERKIKKRRPYELFALCDNLEIEIGKNVVVPQRFEPSQTQNETNLVAVPSQKGMEETVEEESTLSNSEIDALAGAQYVTEELCNKRPNEESLSKEVENLKKLKHQIQSEEIILKIETALQEYDRHIDSIEKEQVKEQEKENKRMDSSAFARCTTIEACEDYLNTYPNGDHVAEVQQKKDELIADQKRNKIWMIVGGILLAILMFVGNQVMQSIRNKKSQINMAKMQQDAVRKAQEMAKQQQQQLQQQANGETQSKKRYTI